MENELSKAERTRQFIIERTSPVFNKKGYAGTSLSDLTEATGLTKGSIYGNFKNKEEVAAEVFEYNSGKVRKQIQERIQRATSYHDKLLVYAQVYHSFTRGDFIPGGCPILNTAVDADDTNPLLKDKAARAVIRWKTGIENLIKAGIEAGELKADINITETALSMIALIEGGIMISKVTDSPANLDIVLASVYSLVDGLKL
ncbi:TetR/AcrR family transcriptional regulator [Mucilaginibacter sp. NFR10]|jgi:AcrR family transcriptional regulator|uniref:TetR/AcrR family transcriptional regulator n=1 Tax=Mucilaginibacter sp. NFR10 TaxID=1566292 RepID=UPI0008713DAC|nr:TetR/AcrR family transcriptional regulator [Mucilaginibacter sp. NFR10]SCW61292.1 transcriptional regulator, TetR family [Mucilaginibacter sp. NFR10]